MPGTAAAEQSSCQGTAQTTGVKGGRLCTQTCTLCALRHPLQGTPPRTPAQAQPQRLVMDAACEVAVDSTSEAGWRSHMPSNAHVKQWATPACHPRHPHSCTAGQHCYWCWQGSLRGDASTSSDCIGQTNAFGCREGKHHVRTATKLRVLAAQLAFPKLPAHGRSGIYHLVC